MSDLWTEKYRFQHRLQGVINGLSEEIAEALEGALEATTAKIVALEVKADGSKSYAFKKKYLNRQKAEAQKVLTDVYADIDKAIRGKATELAQATPEMVDAMVKNAGITVQLGVPHLDKKTVKGWFESFQVEGTYFNDWMSKLESNTAARIVKEARESLLLHESLRETGKRIQNALSVGRRSAEGLAHNAVHGAYSWAEREYWQENQETIRGLRLAAELDKQTCPLCASLDQKVFPTGEAPAIPLHWRCRCMLLPVFRGEKYINRVDRRITRQDTEARTVKHRDGTTSTKYEKLRVKFVPQGITHHKWVQSLAHSIDPKDVAFAREMLGKTRFGLVKAGKLDVKSLYYHGKLRTIAELKRLMK